MKWPIPFQSTKQIYLHYRTCKWTYESSSQLWSWSPHLTVRWPWSGHERFCKVNSTSLSCKPLRQFFRTVNNSLSESWSGFYITLVYHRSVLPCFYYLFAEHLNDITHYENVECCRNQYHEIHGYNLERGFGPLLKQKILLLTFLYGLMWHCKMQVSIYRVKWRRHNSYKNHLYLGGNFIPDISLSETRF